MPSTKAFDFISDLHLSEQQPETLAFFQRYLAGLAGQIDGLFILGDLFEWWLGDDAIQAWQAKLVEQLRGLTERGVALYLMQGNRDVLLGNAFAQRCAAQLLPDPYPMQLDGQHILLSHGDAWCTEDTDYQRFRQQVRAPLWQKNFLALPLAERLAQAKNYRNMSRQANQEKTSSIMDVYPPAVQQAQQHHNSKHVIHGHTHRPARHQLPDFQRWVLGDWHADHAIILRWQRGAPALQRLQQHDGCVIIRDGKA